jgi:hypothetical protein
MEIMGVRIPTIIADNIAIRCDGCHGIIRGTPWRISILDVVSTEIPASWAGGTPINPGPFQFHPDPDHVRAWMATRGYFLCRKSEVREIMRPVPLPPADLDESSKVRYGLCDGIHRDNHEFVAA